MANFQLFCFSVQGTVGSLTGPDSEKNRVGDQDTGSPGGPASFGLHVSGEQEHCCARERILGDFPTAFSFKMSFNFTSIDEYHTALIVRPFQR